MNTWDLLKDSFKEFYYHSDNSQIVNNGCDICLNVTKNMSLCSVFIDNNFNFNINPLDNINSMGYIYASPQHRNNISSLSKNIRFLKSGTIMTCDIQNMPELIKSDDVDIELVSNSSSKIKDYINIICSLYNISEEEARTLFNIDYILNSNCIYIFCAYVENKPVGFLEAVQKDDSAFVLAAYVIDEYRNTKILTSLAMYSIQYAIGINVKKYSALTISEFSMKLMSAIGFLEDYQCDVWVLNK